MGDIESVVSGLSDFRGNVYVRRMPDGVELVFSGVFTKFDFDELQELVREHGFRIEDFKLSTKLGWCVLRLYLEEVKSGGGSES